MKKILKLFIPLLLFLMMLAGCGTRPVELDTDKPDTDIVPVTEANLSEEPVSEEPVQAGITEEPSAENNIPEEPVFSITDIPDYSGEEVLVINGDEPMFTEEEKTYSGTYIRLSELDSLGRCGVAMAVVGQETMPEADREDISKVKPSGWIQEKYNGHWLYNRSHLLMFALTGLNDDKRNLITGTEYFNQTLMLGWEEMIRQYIYQFNGHVVYRVTPVFDQNNLVAKGVLMEAYSIEYPEECTFCRFVYNIPDPEWNVTIDYATGESWRN